MTTLSASLADTDEARAEQLIDAATSLLPAIRSSARESENRRHVIPEVISLAEDAGLFKTMVPKKFGGYGLGTRPLCEIARTLTHGDPSAAWAIGFLIEHNWMICRLPMTGQERVFEGRTHVLASAPLVPNGKAVKVDGGYLISGTWPYGSGTMNSTHALVVCPVDVDGEAVPYTFFISLDEATVNDDWFISGMAATSSCTITGTEIFVPDDLALEKDLLLSPTGHPGASHDESIYRAPMMPTLTHMMTALILGTAERTVEIARERLASSRPYGHARINRDLSRDRWMKAHQDVRAAQMMYRNSLDEIVRKGDVGEEWTEQESGQLQLDQLSVAQLAKRAVRLTLDGMGSSAYKLDDPLQRYLRDINVIANHLGFDHDVMAEQATRKLLGLGRRDYDPYPPRKR